LFPWEQVQAYKLSNISNLLIWEVKKMNVTFIIVIVLVAIFIVGGVLAGHYATKASEKDTGNMNNNQNK
jgi:uncharacterized membrane protein